MCPSSDVISIISTIAGAVSAIAAAFAVGMTYKLYKNQKEERKEERKSSYYKIWITEPLTDAIDSYTEAVFALLSSGFPTIVRIKAGENGSDIVQTVKNLIHDYNNLYRKLKHNILTPTAAWEESSFHDEIQESTHNHQDLITENLERMAISGIQRVLVKP